MGPFDVVVVGTRFSIAWDPEKEVFSLELEKGSVRVKGPGLKQKGPGLKQQVVSAGQRVRVWVREGKVQHRSRASLVAEKKSPVAKPVAAKPVAAKPVAAKPVVAKPVVAKPVASGATRPMLAKRQSRKRRSQRKTRRLPRSAGKAPLSLSAPATTTTSSTLEPVAKAPALKPPPTKRPKAGPWDLARAGRYKEAMARAAKEGWAKVIASASAKQLLTLADAARLAGNQSRSRKLFLALRSRFHGSPEAAAAAFALGRLAFDYQRQPLVAARYFQRYLAEEPRGPLAKAALGRLLEARVRAKQWDFACATARSYLLRFAGGSHTRLAQRILARCKARP
ncbi:MAG: hypothetical protein JRH20_06640 [Deltaproteobacteria bacterium]|nr:hypothetical protein [Deltaproteobacteria bacterium]